MRVTYELHFIEVVSVRFASCLNVCYVYIRRYIYLLSKVSDSICSEVTTLHQICATGLNSSTRSCSVMALKHHCIDFKLKHLEFLPHSLCYIIDFISLIIVDKLLPWGCVEVICSRAQVSTMKFIVNICCKHFNVTAKDKCESGF